MYHGTHYEDVVDHIAKVLKMVDSIYVPGVDSHQLRMKVFPLSLADDGKEWWISDENENIITSEELVEKFFCRFYPESYDGEDDIWERNEDNMSKIYQDIFQKKDEGWKDLVKEISTNIDGEFKIWKILKCWSLETSRRLFNKNYHS
ncbi:hypothetical protein Tco_0082664 [Tanacetum coccineum]